MEERREEYAKEVTSSILDIKKAEVNHNHNGSNNSNSNNNNQSWFRPRDKNGRFTSSSAITTATVAANTTTIGDIAITTPTTEAATTVTMKAPSWQNKLRDSRGRFISSTASN